MNNFKKIFFVFFITLLFTSCVSASLLIAYVSHNDKLVSSDDYIKKNIIISFDKHFTMKNLDNGKIKYVSTEVWQGRSPYSFEQVSRMIANTLAKEGFNNIFLYIELMDYERVEKHSTDSYSHSGKAGPFDAFQSGTNAATGIMDSMQGQNMYVIRYTVFDIINRQDKKIHLDQKGKNLDQDQSFYKIQKKAKSGDAEAQFYLSHMYYDGEGVAIDKEQAFYWCKQSAEQGYTKAQYVLGFMFYEGEGTLIDKKEAAYWTKQAYKKGFQPAKEFWEKYELWKYQD